MMVTYGLVAILLCFWLARMVIQEKILIKRTPFDIPILLFLGSQILSTIFSIHPRTSLLGYYGRFNGGLLSTITYTTFYYVVANNLSRNQVKGLLLTLFASAFGVTVYTLPEHFGHSPSCWLISGGKNFGVSCWVQDVQNRIFGTFGQPNWLAAYTIVLIPLGIALSAISPSKIKKISFAAITVLLTTTLLFTKSRSGFLGLAIGLGVFLGGVILSALSRKKKLHFEWSMLPWKSISLLFLGLATPILIFGSPYTPSVSQLIHQEVATEEPPITDQTQNPVDRLEVGGTDSGEIRKIVWKGAIDVWKRYPLLGSGVETFAYSYYKDRPMEHNLVSEWDFLYNKAHNEFLNFLATTGIVGLTTYLLLLGWFGVSVLLQLWPHKQASTPLSNQEKIVAAGLSGGITALSVSNFFGFSTVTVNLLMYLFWAIFAVLLIPQKQINRATKSISTFQYFSLGMVFLIGAYILIIISNTWKADVLYASGTNLAKSTDLIQGAQELEQAVLKSPHEAIYQDQLASAYAQIAVALAETNDATLAAQFTQKAVETSDQAMKLNSVHLNLYKDRARIYILLAQINPNYLHPALETLDQAQQLAPTDPKITYNRALISLELGQTEIGQQLLETTLKMKPNYGAARIKLAELLAKQGKIEESIQQYQYILDYINPEDEASLKQIEALRHQVES